MKYSDAQRIEKICTMTEKLLNYLRTSNITEEIIVGNEPIRWAITTPLYNIGEHAYCLSDNFKAAYNQIPWNRISGLRHRLVHDYDNTSWSTICSVIFEVLPVFYDELKEVDKTLRENKGDNIS